jgi:hypothetical protein
MVVGWQLVKPHVGTKASFVNDSESKGPRLRPFLHDMEWCSTGEVDCMFLLIYRYLTGGMGFTLAVARTRGLGFGIL